MVSLLGAGVPRFGPLKHADNRRCCLRQGVLTIRQIRSLLYGFTIGGARQRLSSAQVWDDGSRNRQLIRQMIVELEEVLQILCETA